MKRRHLQFKVRTWLLLMLLPTLTAVSGWIGIDLYLGLRSMILAGFDKELAAVSVVTAAFIDSGEHAWLAEERRVQAPVYLPESDAFWALADDWRTGRLVKIDASDGRMDDEAVALAEPLRDLAYVPAHGGLLGLDARGDLHAVNVESGAMIPLEWTPADLSQIATDYSSGDLLGEVKGELVRIDLKAQQTTRIGSLPEALEPAILLGSVDGHTLWFNNRAQAKLVSMDSTDGSKPGEHPWLDESPPPGQIAYDSKRGRWVEAAEQLRWIDLQEGVNRGGDYGAAYGREASAIYQNAVAPMQRLRERLGLTYLYTLQVRNMRDITYILDSSLDDDHSPLLAKDVLPDSEVDGVERLRRTGALHFTEIRRWDQWGWIKSAFAPILSPQGDVTAMAGADVNVSVISQQTRTALLTVFLLGATSLVLASVWSLQIAKWLRRPVEELKRGAMSVATGDFQVLAIKGAREFIRLNRIFNEVGERMTVSRNNQTHEVARLLLRRDRAEVLRVFAHERDVERAFRREADVRVTGRNPTYGGAIRNGDVVWVWWERPMDADDVPGATERLRRFSTVPERVKARFQPTAHPVTPIRWPSGVIAVLRVDFMDRTAVVWHGEGMPGDERPLVRPAEGQGVLIGWSAAGPELTVQNLAIQEVRP